MAVGIFYSFTHGKEKERLPGGHGPHRQSPIFFSLFLRA